jgi:hypothetical protein
MRMAAKTADASMRWMTVKLPGRMSSTLELVGLLSAAIGAAGDFGLSVECGLVDGARVAAGVKTTASAEAARQ